MLLALDRGGVLIMRARQVFRLLSLACIVWAPSLHAVPVTSCDTVCQEGQVRALLELYTATQGSQWLLSEGWSSLTLATPITTVCAFLASNNHGFCCDSSQALCPADYGVSMLVLVGNNLKGTLPPSLLPALGPTLLWLGLNSMEPHAAILVPMC